MAKFRKVKIFVGPYHRGRSVRRTPVGPVPVKSNYVPDSVRALTSEEKKHQNTMLELQRRSELVSKRADIEMSREQVRAARAQRQSQRIANIATYQQVRASRAAEPSKFSGILDTAAKLSKLAGGDEDPYAIYAKDRRDEIGILKKASNDPYSLSPVEAHRYVQITGHNPAVDDATLANWGISVDNIDTIKLMADKNPDSLTMSQYLTYGSKLGFFPPVSDEWLAQNHFVSGRELMQRDSSTPLAPRRKARKRKRDLPASAKAELGLRLTNWRAAMDAYNLDPVGIQFPRPVRIDDLLEYR